MTNAEHKAWQRKGAAGKHRPVPQSFYDSPPWRLVRAAVLLRDGHLCQIRHCCMGAPATTVDHKIPAKLRPDLGLDMDNCQASCAACNTWKQHEDKRNWARLVAKAAALPAKTGPITF